MVFDTPEFKKADGTRFKVKIYMCADYKDAQYRIYDIWYCEPKKRKWKSFGESFRNNFDYRKLDQLESHKYEIKKYIEFVGKDKLEEAIMSAWESLRPNVNDILLED